MLDIKFVRANPDAVKENIKKKFQDEKIPMVDEVIEFDAKYRAAKTRCDELRAQRNKKSKEIGGLMAKGQKDEAEKVKAEVKAMADEMTKLEEDEKVFAEEVKNRMMVIPNIIDPSVPARTIPRTLRTSASASRSFRISRFRTMLTSWSPSTASISTLLAAPPATASTTSRATSRACILLSCPTRATS